MLRKRSRPVPSQSKGHLMPDSTSDSMSPRAKSSSLFNVPGLMVGFCTKGLSDSESTNSPTSTLEYKSFSNMGSFFSRSPRSPGIEGQSRSWDCSRVGLGLVDSLNDETNPRLGFSESKNILFGSQMRMINNIPGLDGLRDDPKSLPKDFGISSQTSTLIGMPCLRSSAEIEHGSSAVDIGRSSLPISRLMYHNLKHTKNSQSKSPPLVIGVKSFDNFSSSLPISATQSDYLMGSLSASEIELSEDYTRVVTHGPNPKTTHIFGNCILESHTMESPDCKNENGEEGKESSWLVRYSMDPSLHPSDEFLSFCFSCKNKLQGEEDISTYSGEKAFCTCEDPEILIAEEMEKPATESAYSPSSSFHEEIFIAT